MFSYGNWLTMRYMLGSIFKRNASFFSMLLILIMIVHTLLHIGCLMSVALDDACTEPGYGATVPVVGSYK